MEARFDFYTATLADPPGALADMFRSRFQADRVSLFRPRHYHQGELWRSPSGHFEATIQHGGTTDRACVEASRYSAHLLARSLRESFPKHRVTRGDACIDWIERDGFDRWSPVLRDVSDRYRIKRQRRDGDGDVAQGRTYYLGAESSVVRLRLYEKGWQLYEESKRSGGRLTPEAVEAVEALPESAVLTDINRLEVQVRPSSQEAKEHMAQVPALGFFGAAKFSSDALAVITQQQVQQLAGLGTVRRESDHTRAIGFVVKQYHRHLTALANELGDWQQVGLYLQREISQMQDREALLRSHQRRGSGGG